MMFCAWFFGDATECPWKLVGINALFSSIFCTSSVLLFSQLYKLSIRLSKSFAHSCATSNASRWVSFSS